jgi:hypothetical protein
MKYVITGSLNQAMQQEALNRIQALLYGKNRFPLVE